MTKAKAIKLAQSRWWDGLPAEAIVAFQLYEPLLCMDFGDFHKAVEEALGRPVWTHEFANGDSLKSEFEGKKSKPSMEEILNLIHKDKRLIFVEAPIEG